MNKRDRINMIVGYGVIAIFILAIIYGMTKSKNNIEPEKVSTPVTIYAKDFVVIQDDHTCSSSYGYMTFTGSVYNISREYTLKYVELRGTVFNANGVQINTDTGYIDSDQLGANKTSTFEILVKTTSEGTKCRVTVEDASFAK